MIVYGKKQMHKKIMELGGYETVARWCNVTRQAVNNWKFFKIKHCAMIHKGSGGRVLPGELRGDVVWRLDSSEKIAGATIELDASMIFSGSKKVGNTKINLMD